MFENPVRADPNPPILSEILPGDPPLSVEDENRRACDRLPAHPAGVGASTRRAGHQIGKARWASREPTGVETAGRSRDARRGDTHRHTRAVCVDRAQIGELAALLAG